MQNHLFLLYTNLFKMDLSNIAQKINSLQINYTLKFEECLISKKHSVANHEL